MSDEEKDRPLTRRERRLREAAEAAASEAAEAPREPEVSVSTAAVDEPETDPFSEADIEISPFNEDGSLRSRREIRQLREAAIAELRAAAAENNAEPEPEPEAAAEVEADAGAGVEGQAETHTGAEADTEAEAEAEAEADTEPELEAEVESETGSPYDPRLAETQPFSAEDLEAFAEESAKTETAEQGESSEADGAEIAEPDTADQDDAEAPHDEEDAADDASDSDAPAADSSAGASAAEADGSGDIESAEEPASEATGGYSFPDIAPLDDQVSVFDRYPRTHDVADSGNDDFDDLISRAVNEETASTLNTSALILPTLPDSASLSGPLGETGEFFVTGSIEMPRSLGETGGGAGIHDSAEIDALDELGFESVHATGDPIAPVAARRAVSATGTHTPIVANQPTEKSRLPLLLMCTGGGLLVAILGLLGWGFASGTFG